MSLAINREDFPYAGSSPELDGCLHAGTPASLMFFDGDPGSGPKLHRHPDAEIFVVQEGSATFTVGEATIEATAGQILITPASVPDKFIDTGSGPLRQIDIHLNDRFETEWLED